MSKCQNSFVRMMRVSACVSLDLYLASFMSYPLFRAVETCASEYSLDAQTSPRSVAEGL